MGVICTVTTQAYSAWQCQLTALCHPSAHCSASKEQTAPHLPAAFSQGEPGVADEPPGRESPSIRAASFKRVPIPWELDQHGWGPRSKGWGKLEHTSPGDGKGRPQICKEVPGTHAVPSSAEEPPPAFVQPSVERSISLPPAACLAAARSNFLCIVPITVPPLPAHPTPLHAPHCQAPYAPAPAPYLAAPQMCLQMFSCIPAHFTDTLCFPLQPLSESCVPPQDVCPIMSPVWIQPEGWNGDI